MGFFQGPFDFNKTLLGQVGCHLLIHAKPATRGSWDFRAKPGFYFGPALDSYRCFKLAKTNTKSQVISDTVKFCHMYLSIPVPSAEDKIIHSCKSPQALSRVHHLLQVSPNSKLSLHFKKSLNHGALLPPHPDGQTTTQLLQVQG